MKLREIAYDIQKVLTKHKITDDARTTITWLEYKINQYRAQAIERKYIEKKNTANPTWIQRFFDVPVAKINSGDYDAVSGCSMALGKFMIPTVIDLPNDKGLYSVTSTLNTDKYYPITLDRFLELVPGSERSNFKYYFRIGFAVYIHPYVPFVNPQLILEDPRLGYTVQNQLFQTLVVGTVYQVTSGRITHNGTAYQKGQTFTAATTTFAGNGWVQLANPVVPMSDDEPYPLDHTLTEEIMMKILTQDFGIELKMIGDTSNDGQDETLRRD